MLIKRSISLVAVLLTVLGLSGCGAHKDAEERRRLELEEQAERDEAKANQAITTMNQKMFGGINAPMRPSPTPAQPLAPSPLPGAPNP